MSIDIVNADRGMIHYILQNLREADRFEMEAAEIDFELLPTLIMKHKAFAFCASDSDIGPVAVWGMVPRRSGVGAGFAFGTDAWGLAVLPMVRQIRNFVLPYLSENGFHRVEAAALANRIDVLRLMDLIHAEPEAVIRGYGCHGEDFISYRWLSNEYRYASVAQSHTGQGSHTSH